MIKIDLHIHTVNTLKDNGFNFDASILKEYVESMKIDCIAITNHNLFSQSNYENIVSALPNCLVLPGIEIDLEKGHILVISSSNDIDDFNEKCSTINKKIINDKKYLTYDEFILIFRDLNNYLIIPHYDKDPSIPDSVLERLGNNFYVGEVQSPKKFSYLKKEKNHITPVLFSDFREYGRNFKVRQTYLKCEECSFQSIKLTLKDKRKVFLTNNENADRFQILEDGTQASYGLNVIIGKRSSGKTYTLNKINNSFGCKHIKYIKQFALIQDSRTDEDFLKKIENKCSDFSMDYLDELRKIVGTIIKIDLKEDKEKIKTYIDSLIEYSKNIEKEDMYSRCSLFNSTNTVLNQIDDLKKYIDSLIFVNEHTKYKKLLGKYIDFTNFGKAITELILEYRNTYFNNEIIELSNTLSNSIKNELGKKSARNPIEECDFKNIFENMYMVDKFNELVRIIDKEKCLKTENPFEGFVQKTFIRTFQNASELNNSLKIKNTKVLFDKDMNAYDKLLILSSNTDIGITKDDIYKTFWKISFSIKNQYGNDLSGGEKAEFNLLTELKESFKYDMVLIDEPESSFDNIFLKSKVIEIINEMSQKSTVFVVTHNNNLGILLKPDLIIYTEKTIDKNGPMFNVYYGELGAKQLVCCNKSISNYFTLIDSMEGGENAYLERKDIYETIKN